MTLFDGIYYLPVIQWPLSPCAMQSVPPNTLCQLDGDLILSVSCRISQAIVHHQGLWHWGAISTSNP